MIETYGRILTLLKNAGSKITYTIDQDRDDKKCTILSFKVRIRFTDRESSWQCFIFNGSYTDMLTEARLKEMLR